MGRAGPKDSRSKAIQAPRIFWINFGAPANDFALNLNRLGYSGLSTFAPRDRVEVAAGVVQVNTHLDEGLGGTEGSVFVDETLNELANVLEEHSIDPTTMEVSLADSGSSVQPCDPEPVESPACIFILK